MTHIKLEHIDNLRRGKKSGAKIGSRNTPHHLYKYEEEKYKRALKYKYLEITNKERVNLKNIWEKVCQAQGWKNYMLIKHVEQGIGYITENGRDIRSGNMKEMKQQIKELVSKK